MTMTRHRFSTACLLLCLAGIAGLAQPSVGQQVWINEVHYDNTGIDADEGVEIAGPAGTDLSNYSLVLYNAQASGTVYSNRVLSGTLPDQHRGYGALWFAAVGLQNGAPDGFALVTPDNTVVQFLSYEGSFTAFNGPAVGMTSVDIGVDEEPPPLLGQSLQLTGTGSNYTQFAWAGPRTQSRGRLNDGQILPSAYRTTVSVLDAAGRFAGAGTLTNLSAAGQPGGIQRSTAGGLVNQAGFLNTFCLRAALDTDVDGLPDEADADNDNDGLDDESEFQGASFNPWVPTAINRADTDEDGATDGEEAVAQTDPTDAKANLAIVRIRAVGTVVNVAWRARGGKTYDVLKTEGSSYSCPTQAVATTNSVGGAWPWFVITNDFNDAVSATNGGFYGIRIAP